MTEIFYQGSDGCIKMLGDNELQHFKYIKKIGNRYFYTPEEIRAYYESAKAVSDTQYAVQKNINDSQRNRRDARLNNNRKRQIREKREMSKNLAIGNPNTGKIRQATKKEQKKYADHEVSLINKKAKKKAKKNARLDKIKDTKLSAIKNVNPVVNTGKAMAEGRIKDVTNSSKKNTNVKKKTKKRPRPRIITDGKEYYSSRTVRETVR